MGFLTQSIMKYALNWQPVPAFLLFAPAFAAFAQSSYQVTVGTGSGTGTLYEAIQTANSSSGPFTINIQADLTIQPDSQMFIALANANQSQPGLTINGNGATIDMSQANSGSGDRAFFIAAGSVALNNLTISNGSAVGGNGTDSGGGGAGLGGAIFVANGQSITAQTGAITQATSVRLSDVRFVNNQAVGGNGSIFTARGTGGGGGMGGNGGSGYLSGLDTAGGGGGGLGFGANGGSGSFAPEQGSDGIFNVPGNAFAAGNGGDGGANGGSFGGGGGGGDRGLFESGAGGGGGVFGSDADGHTGGNGGFGGGGGGAGADHQAGRGGFGGGGGGGDPSGQGGFGGGAGGLPLGTNSTSSGGFGGGSSDNSSGGGSSGAGGAAMGGAVFVQSGSQLTIAQTASGTTSFQGSTVSAGQPGDSTASEGSMIGADVFLGGNVVFDIEGSLDIAQVGGSGNSADPNVADHLNDPNAQGGLIKTGSGTLALNGENFFRGSPPIDDAPGSPTTGLTVNNGTVALSEGASLVGPISVTVGSGSGADNSTLELRSNSSLTLDGFAATNPADSGITLGDTSPGTLILGSPGGSGAFLGASSINGGTSGGSVIFRQQYDYGSLSDTEYEVVAALTGNLSVIQDGAGTTTLAGTNSYTGETFINSGTLRLLGDNPLPMGNNVTVQGGTLDILSIDGNIGQIALLTVTSGSVIDSDDSPGSVVPGQTFTEGGSIEVGIGGAGSLTQRGSGTTILWAPNTYSGGTFIQSGTLRLAVPGALPSVGDVSLSGGILDINHAGSTNLSIGSLTVDGGTVQNGAGPSGLNPAEVLTSSGTLDVPLTGASALHQIGLGTTILSRANSYSGGTFVTQGTLQLGSLSSLPSGGNLTLSGGILDLHDAGTTSKSIGTLVMTGGTIQNSVGNSGLTPTSITVEGGRIEVSLTGTGALTKNNHGLLTLSGENDYSGGTVVNGGTLRLENADALPTDRAVTLAGGTLDLNEAGAGSRSIGVFTLTSGSIMNSLGTAGLSPSGTLTQSGEIAASLGGSGSLHQNLAGVTVLSAPNSYTGGTQVTAGTLRVEHEQGLPVVGDVFIGQGEILTGTLDIRGTGITYSIGNLTLSDGAIINGSGDASLTPSSVTTANGSLSVSIVGPTALLQQAGEFGGTTVLGAANTYTGGTTIAAGTLQLAAAGALPEAGAVMLQGGTLDLNSDGSPITVGAFQISSGSSLINSSGNASISPSSLVANLGMGEQSTVSAALSGSGSVTVLGQGALTLSGNNTYAGGTIVNSEVGTGLQINSLNALPQNGDLTLQNGSIGLNFVGTATIGRLIMQNGEISGSTLSPVETRVQSGILQTAITGNGSLIQEGSATDTTNLNAINTYTGGTFVRSGYLNLDTPQGLPAGGDVTIEGGILDIDTGSTPISLGVFTLTSGSLINSTVDAGGLVIGITPTQTNLIAGTVAAPIGGTSSLTKTGAGTASISHNNSYSGATLVKSGTLELASGASIQGTSSLVVGDTAGDDATLLLSDGATINLATGSSVIELGREAGASGTLQIGSGSGAGADLSGLEVRGGTGGGTVVFSQEFAFGSTDNGVYEFQALLTGNLEILQDGPGTTVLAPSGGRSTFSGNVAIRNGALRLETATSLQNVTSIHLQRGAFHLGTSEAVNNASVLTQSGGTLEIRHQLSETFGAWIVNGNTVVDFMGNSSTLNFASLDLQSGLSIWNWLPGTTVITIDGPTSGDLSQISFFEGDGEGFLGVGALEGTQLIAVPEPSTGLLAAMAIFFGVALLARGVVLGSGIKY